jgi:uncharacterized phage-associated protein
MHFDEQKATAVAAYFLEQAGGQLEDLKLMKLMYFAEREAIRCRNVGITGDWFYSMQNGPVLSETLNLMADKEGAGSGPNWNEHIQTPSLWHVRLTRPIEFGAVLSIREIEILRAVWADHGRKNKWNLVDLTHAFPEWDKRARDFKTSILIRRIDILGALGLDKAAIQSRLAEDRAAIALDEALADARRVHAPV